MSSFAPKRLRVALILAGTNQVFPGTNSNTLTLENLRVSARAQCTARLSMEAEVRIYGMKAEDMNALTVVWANPPVILNHLIILEANNSGRADGWAQVFKGTIMEAQPDYRSAPDVSFNLLAKTGYYVQVNMDFAAPTSYQEEVDIGAIASDIVDRMGAPWTFTNGGADGVLSSPYYSGTLWDQLAQACHDAKADFYAQGDNILIVPAGRSRPGAPSVVLSKDSGLVGYPMFERSGLNVTALFDPAFLCGSALEVQTVVPNASGIWFPYSLSHTLDARIPHGAWFSQMQCLRVALD